MKSVLIAATTILNVAMVAIANAQPLPPLANFPSDTECPLGRVAMVRGSDSEAREGGGFYAARKNGIHGAVDLNGWVGEPVFAVANGKVIVAEGRSDWGKLGKTVVLAHQDGGYTIYGHLHTVEVRPSAAVSTGDMIGTIGYSGNARSLQAKNLPPHLHFGYFRPAARANGDAALARIKDSGEGFRFRSAKDAIMADLAGIVNPIRAVGFMKCWEDPPSASALTKP